MSCNGLNIFLRIKFVGKEIFVNEEFQFKCVCIKATYIIFIGCFHVEHVKRVLEVIIACVLIASFFLLIDMVQVNGLIAQEKTNGDGNSV